MDSIFIFGGRVLFPVITQRLAFLFLYLGPDTIMPLASILAAVIGFILLFWRYIVNIIKKIFRRGKASSIVNGEDSLIDPDLTGGESQDDQQNPVDDKQNQI